MCLLSSVPFRLHTPPVGLVIYGLAPHPHRASLPHTLTHAIFDNIKNGSVG